MVLTTRLWHDVHSCFSLKMFLEKENRKCYMALKTFKADWWRLQVDMRCSVLLAHFNLNKMPQEASVFYPLSRFFGQIRNINPRVQSKFYTPAMDARFPGPRASPQDPSPFCFLSCLFTPLLLLLKCINMQFRTKMIPHRCIFMYLQWINKDIS